MNKYRLLLLAGCSVFGLDLGHASSAIAQTQAAADNGKVADVIVTARKRSESLLTVPVAVSALTAKDLADRAILTLDDVANFVPGLTDDQTGGNSARSDRSFQTLIIRGMTPSSTNIPTTSIFINGTPVGSPDFLQTLDDVERVEVLKGPQSAYFGRETFAGAVNVITKPATDTLTGDFSATIGTRNTYRVSGTISGPIIPDKLLVSAGGTYDTHDGSYRNAFDHSQTLGDQTTKMVHVGITAKPVQNLTIKLYSQYFQDDDGPAATGLLIGGFPYGAFSTSSAAIAKYTQGNCTVAGTPFFCGTLPGLISSGSPAQTTTITPAIAAFLANPVGSIVKPSDTVKGFGLKRDAFHIDGNVEYLIPTLGLTVTYLSSYNHSAWSELSDLSNEDTAPGGQYPGGSPGLVPFPYMVQQVARDMSQEIRVATDQSKPYRALVGLSYVETYSDQALGLAEAPFGAIVDGGTSASDTTGVFFALAYDILPVVTINFDGRYQMDVEKAYNGGVKSAEGKFDDFLPRVTLQYKFMPDMMTYFTYSKGVNPGPFDTSYAALPAASQQELQSKGLAGGGLVVNPEYLTNYEVGFKGRFFGGKATLAADAYYDDWTNQIQNISFAFPANDPANPLNIPTFAGYIPNNTSPDPYSGYSNAAKSIARGVEAESAIIPIEHVSINLAAAYNDIKYTTYNCTACQPYKTYNAEGKFLPNSPKFSFAGGIEYSNVAYLFSNTEKWFVRADVIYKDGFYLEASNTVKTPDTEIVNVRAGMSWNNLTLEAFVDNLFNHKTYTSGIPDFDFGGFFAPTTFMLGLNPLITGGVRLRYKY